MADYSIEGEGEPVIILHGSYGGIEQARLLGEPLRKNGFRTISLARPGYPGTPLDEGKTAEEQADLIDEIMREEGIDQAHLYAYSAGGPIAIEMMRKYPEKVMKTVMDSTVIAMEAFDSQMPDRLFLNDLIYYWPLMNITDLVLRATATLFPKKTFRMASNSEPDEDDIEFFSKILETTFPLSEKKKGIKNDFLITNSSMDLPDDLGSSILAINYGELEKIRESTATLEERYEDIETVVMDDGGHMTWMQNDPRKEKRVIEFLR